MTIDGKANISNPMGDAITANTPIVNTQNNKKLLVKAPINNNKPWSCATTCVAVAAGIFTGGYIWGIPLGLLAGSISHRVLSSADQRKVIQENKGDIFSILDDENGNSLSYTFNDCSTGVGGYLLSFVDSNYEGSVTEGILLLNIKKVAFTILFNLNNKEPITDLQLAHLLVWLSVQYDKGEVDLETCRNIFLALHCHVPNRRGRAKSDKSFITKKQFTDMYRALSKNENFIETAYKDFLLKV